MNLSGGNGRGGAGPTLAGGSGASDETPRRGRHASPGPSSAQLIISLLHDIPGMISDRVHLAALELRRARHALLQMVVLAVIAAVLVTTAWLAFCAAIVLALRSMGMLWYGAIVLVLLVNAIGGWLAIRRARALVDHLALPATVRHLTLPASSASGLGPGDVDARNPNEIRATASPPTSGSSSL